MIRRLGHVRIDAPHISYQHCLGGGVDDESTIDPEQTNNLLRLTESTIDPKNHWDRGLLLLFKNVRYHKDNVLENENGKLYPNAVHLVVKGIFQLYEDNSFDEFSKGDVFSHDVTRLHSVDTDILCGTIILGYF